MILFSPPKYRLLGLAFLLLTLPTLSSYGQSAKIDSLEELTHSDIPAIRINAMKDLGLELRFDDWDRSFGLLNEALDHSKKYGEVDLERRLNTSLGISYGMRGEFDQALPYFIQSMAIAKSIQHGRGIAEANSNMGIVFKNLGDYPTSLEYYTKATEIYDSLQDQSGLATCYSNLGVLYDLLNDPEASMNYYLKAQEIYKATGEDYSYILMNIALVKRRTGEFDESIASLKEYLAVMEKRGKKYNIGNAYVNLGYVYLKMKEYELSESYSLKSLEILREIGNKKAETNALFNLGNSYLERGQYEKALATAIEHMAKAEETKSWQLMAQGREMLAKIHSAQGNYKEAYDQQLLFNDFIDSIYTEEKANSLQQWETRLGVRHKNEEIKAKNLELELLASKDQLKQRWNWILGLGVFLFGTIAFFWYRQGQIQKRSNNLLVEKNATIKEQKKEIEQINVELEKRMLRAQINPHFIFNSLGSIQHFITTNDKRSALKYLSRFSNLLRQTLESSISVNVILKEEIDLLRTYLELEALRFDQQFHYAIETDPALDIYNTEVPILLVQPFIENAILHGLMPKQGERRLLISFEEGGEFTICKIKDNGVGRTAAAQNKPRRPSRGLSVTKQRIQLLQAGEDETELIEIIDLHNPDGSAAGTEVIVQIPKS